jgi:hypothetical protein
MWIRGFFSEEPEIFSSWASVRRAYRPAVAIVAAWRKAHTNRNHGSVLPARWRTLYEIASSRTAASPLPSFAPSRKTSAGRPSPSKPTVAVSRMPSIARAYVSFHRRFGSRWRWRGSRRRWRASSFHRAREGVNAPALSLRRQDHGLFFISGTTLPAGTAAASTSTPTASTLTAASVPSSALPSALGSAWCSIVKGGMSNASRIFCRARKRQAGARRCAPACGD